MSTPETATMAAPWLSPTSDADKAYERSRSEKRDEDWQRECALLHALNLHKNNGCTNTAAQTVADAATFLTFLKGETK